MVCSNLDGVVVAYLKVLIIPTEKTTKGRSRKFRYTGFDVFLLRKTVHCCNIEHMK